MNRDTAPRTVADLCEVTGLHRETVTAAILAGSLPGYKVGSRFVIPGEAFERLCRGEWVPQHRVVVEVVSPDNPQPSSFIKRRKGVA